MILSWNQQRLNLLVYIWYLRSTYHLSLRVLPHQTIDRWSISTDLIQLIDRWIDRRSIDWYDNTLLNFYKAIIVKDI